MNKVVDSITHLLQDCFDRDDLVATPGLAAKDVEGWDSLAHVRLMLMVERAFNITISASEAANLKNVGQLVAMVSRKTGLPSEFDQ